MSIDVQDDDPLNSSDDDQEEEEDSKLSSLFGPCYLLSLLPWL